MRLNPSHAPSRSPVSASQVSVSVWSSPRPRFRFYDVPEQTLAIARDVISFRVTRGDDVADLETSFRELGNVRHAHAVPQARIGIFLAVSALTGRKKKVILSPYTIHDVINMVICAGGEPVFADIERDTCNISASQIAQLVDDDTAAVVVTHLHGLACDVERIRDICEKHRVPLIEDAAQALGARVNGQMVGTFGDVGIYSFGRAKNINALYGGLLITRNRDVADSVAQKLSTWPYFPTRRLISQAALCLATNVAFSPPWFPAVIARLLQYSHIAPLDPLNKVVRGEGNPTRRAAIHDDMLVRMTPLQARLVIRQLDEVDRLSAVRTQYAKVYHDGLANLPEIIIQPWRDDRSHIYLTFPIQVPDRETLLTFLMRHRRDVARQQQCRRQLFHRVSPAMPQCPGNSEVDIVAADLSRLRHAGGRAECRVSSRVLSCWRIDGFGWGCHGQHCMRAAGRDCLGTVRARDRGFGAALVRPWSRARTRHDRALCAGDRNDVALSRPASSATCGKVVSPTTSALRPSSDWEVGWDSTPLQSQASGGFPHRKHWIRSAVLRLRINRLRPRDGPLGGGCLG